MTEDTETRGGRHLRTLAVLAALIVVAVTTMEASRAAFSATTSNGPNSVTAGTVALSDDDGGSVMFNVGPVGPGNVQTRCINVTYTGTLASNIRLYGTVGGSGLAQYLDTTIEIGTGAAGGGSFDCTGFSATSTLHNGTLAAFGAANTNFATGLAGFNGATNPTTRSYRIVIDVANNNAAQGLAASTTLTWESQNV